MMDKEERDAAVADLATMDRELARQVDLARRLSKSQRWYDTMAQWIHEVGLNAEESLEEWADKKVNLAMTFQAGMEWMARVGLLYLSKSGLEYKLNQDNEEED